jgi:5-methyltetrahydropteroyltriglutamate--homocysteine methyltransferase
MKRSTERFLTTHTGSLPRPPDLIRMMYAKEEGVPVDPEALSQRVADAVAEVVRKQAESGVDIVNDGEMSKPSYATYIKDRLSGFGGEGNTFVYQDLAEFPNLAKRVFGDPGRSRRKTPACNAAIGVRDAKAAETDVAHLRAALAGVTAAEGFLTAASPGVVSLFFKNEHYGSEEAYLDAIAEAMRVEYEAIAAAGFQVQVDDAWLGALWDRIGIPMGMDGYRKFCEMRCEALNHALRNIPEEQIRYHLCWGSWHGPHSADLPLPDVVDIILRIKAQMYLIEAANVRHEHEIALWEDTKLPDGKIIAPGVVTHSTPLVEHPQLVADRIERWAKLVGRENVIASTDCGLGLRLHPQLAWAKLKSLTEGAALASESLWT